MTMTLNRLLESKSEAQIFYML